MQQTISGGKCKSCHGTGQIDIVTCPRCFGKKIATHKKVVEITVMKGMDSGDKIPLLGEGNTEFASQSVPDPVPAGYRRKVKPAGNFVIVLEQKAHKRFSRDGFDLLLVPPVRINEMEAAKGFEKSIQHLDGRFLKLKVNKGELENNKIGMVDTIKKIENEGMPNYGKFPLSISRGRLFVKFRVVLDGHQSPNDVVEAGVTGIDAVTLKNVEAGDIDLSEFGSEGELTIPKGPLQPCANS